MRLKRAREVVGGFSGGAVLVLGDCMLDHWLWGTVTRISPEAPVPVVDVERSTYTPGGAANVVHNLCGLGARVGIVGIVGQDDAGRRLRGMLKEQGADVRGLLADATRPTTTKTRIIAHSQQVVRADAELRQKLDGGLASRLLRLVRPHLGAYGAMLVSDYNKGVVSEPLLHPLLDAAMQRGVLVVAQPKPENLRMFPAATVVALNEKEAYAATGLHAHDPAGAEQAAAAIMQITRCNAVLITRGAQGMSLVEASRKAHHVTALARQVYDVSGAGDTVVSVLTLALVAGATLVEATQLANYAAAVVVQKVGTATATPQEIVDILREHA